MKIIELINKSENDKYSYLRVDRANLFIENRLLQVSFSVPYDIYNTLLSEEDKAKIFAAVREAVPNHFNIKIEYVRQYADEKLLTKYIVEFINNNYKTLINNIKSGDIKINIDSDVNVEIGIKNVFFSYAEKSELKSRLSLFLEEKVNKRVFTNIVNTGKDDELAPIKSDEGIITMYARRIYVSDVNCITGAMILGYPEYISDNKIAKKGVVLCGTVKSIVKKVAKSNNNVFYVMDIGDTTDTITVKYFTKAAASDVLDGIKIGDDVLVKGNCAEENYMNKKGVSLLMNSLSTCVIDYNSVKPYVDYKKLPDYYGTVKPKEYSLAVQQDLAGNCTDIVSTVCPDVVKRDYVVFDIETTGIDPAVDKIIEIGAVKISGGVIKETFSSFVYPEMNIPAEASKINKIFDADVKDAPVIEKVLPDFLNFAQNSVLVAHNAKFDTAFIKRETASRNYKYEFSHYCTMEMARKRIVSKNYKLETLIKAVGINNDNAHRALSDALATAKLFLYMAENMGIN